MKLSVSAYRAHSSAHKKILSSSYQSQLNYGSTAAVPSSAPSGLLSIDPRENMKFIMQSPEIDRSENISTSSDLSTSNLKKGTKEHDLSNSSNSECKNQNQRKNDSNMCEEEPDQFNFDWTKSNQRWMKLRTTVQISSAIQKKPPLKREDSFLKRFSTRQIPDTQETVEDTESESATGDHDKSFKRRRRYLQKRKTVVNPDENFYFYWLMVITTCVLYNLWTLIVRQSFPELQQAISKIWIMCDGIADIAFVMDLIIQLRTGYLEQGLMVYDDKKLAIHYMRSKDFFFDTVALMPLDLLQFKFGFQPLIRFPRFLKVYRSIRFYYIVESRTVWPNLWRVVNLIHILLILAHWFGCFYYLLSEAEGFQGDWVYPYRPGDYATLARKYLGSLYWSTLTLTTIGDLPTPETNAEPSNSADGPRPLPRRGIKSRLLQFGSNYGYVFTIVSYLIGVFIFATIVGQVGNVITNRNANRLEFERLLDGAKTYMRHHKVPGGMKRRVLRWYDYSWSRGRIQGGGDINTALGLLPDKLKTELALHVNLSVLKKVTIFQECQPEFLHDLVLKMKAYIFTPGDSICRKGEVAREMFIIADGILEVLSETGKVLTTMKAGDFFGEIGILNLDGLNKRTADVRSVGYSELFSLSREDVLAAMKDYPEAQEILQTLGRKRLMEVRFVNKKQAQLASEKASESRTDDDNIHVHSASKKFVGKLKSDVKIFKGALKKSRASKTNETLEMKPLYGITANTSKNLLKRMPRVKSDENQHSVEENVIEKEKIPSPIGAGLPLLQRLRLLKEKQDREEQASKTTSHIISPLAARNISPQQSIQEEPDIRHRNNYVKTETDVSTDKNALPNVTSPTTSVPGIGTKNSIIAQLTKNIKQHTTDTLQYPQKPVLKVSFREKILQLQKAHKNSVVTNEQFTKTNIIPTISNVTIQPTTEIKTKHFNDELNSLKPWSKLKLATLISTGSYTSLTNSCSDITNLTENINDTMSNFENNKNLTKNRIQNLEILNLNQKEKKYQYICDLSPEYNGLPFVKKLKILNERQKLLELESLFQTRSFSLDNENSKNISDTSNSLYRSQSDTSGIHNNKIYPEFFDFPTYNSATEDKCLNSTLSPESNETPERRKLKSILKKLNQNKINGKHQQIRDDHLLSAHTLEGYVARHSKLLKSVTFNSTLSSPPNQNENPIQSIEENIIKNYSFAGTSNKEKKLSGESSYQDITDENLHDNIGYQETFTEAINNIVLKHIQEMHKTFRDQLYIMESEVHKRDAIINKLENKLKKNNQSPSNSIISLPPFRTDNFEDDSSDSSEDKYFMNGDSINTIKGSITSPLPIRYKEIQNNSNKNISLSPIHCNITDGESYRRFSDDYQNEIPLNFESTALRSASGIIVDIDESDSTNSTSGQSNLVDDEITTNSPELTKQNFRKHSNDWEVRMLAAELDRRERKRGQSVSENITTIKPGPFLRRRRKFSDTETECSETDAEIYSRPRAVSLDQFNLGYRTDRIKLTKEKDRL